MKKTKPRLTTSYATEFLNAIGRGKLELLHKQEVLKNNFAFQKFAVELEKFRMTAAVELGEIVKVTMIRRSEYSEDRDRWGEELLKKGEKNPWEACTDKAREVINAFLREDDGESITVEQKYIVMYNGIPAGRRLERGPEGVVRASKNLQLSFPIEATQHHDTPREAKDAAEKLRAYLAAYERKSKKTKRSK